jgi:hypothetical protein
VDRLVVWWLGRASSSKLSLPYLLAGSPRQCRWTPHVRAKPTGSFGPVDINTHSTAQRFLCRALRLREMASASPRTSRATEGSLGVASSQQTRTRIGKQQQGVGGSRVWQTWSSGTQNGAFPLPICARISDDLLRLLPSSHTLAKLQYKMLRVIAAMVPALRECSAQSRRPKYASILRSSQWAGARIIVGWVWFFGSL